MPYRDFAFGACPGLGRGSTSSNRGDGQRSIQLFSADGRYNGAGASLHYAFTAIGSPEGYADDGGTFPTSRPGPIPVGSIPTSGRVGGCSWGRSRAWAGPTSPPWA